MAINNYYFLIVRIFSLLAAVVQFFIATIWAWSISTDASQWKADIEFWLLMIYLLGGSIIFGVASLLPRHYLIKSHIRHVLLSIYWMTIIIYTSSYFWIYIYYGLELIDIILISTIIILLLSLISEIFFIKPQIEKQAIL